MARLTVFFKEFGWIAQCTNLRELFVQASPKCADNYAKLTQLTVLGISHADWTLQDALKLTSLTLLKSLTFTTNCKKMTRGNEKELLDRFSPDVRTKLSITVT
jgi:hypothetical protein